MLGSKLNHASKRDHSSGCDDKALLAKMYPTHLLISGDGGESVSKDMEVRIFKSNYIISVWYSTEYVKLYQLCYTFQFTSKSQNIPHRVRQCMEWDTTTNRFKKILERFKVCQNTQGLTILIGEVKGNNYVIFHDGQHWDYCWPITLVTICWTFTYT